MRALPPDRGEASRDLSCRRRDCPEPLRTVDAAGAGLDMIAMVRNVELTESVDWRIGREAWNANEREDERQNEMPFHAGTLR